MNGLCFFWYVSYARPQTHANTGESAGWGSLTCLSGPRLPLYASGCVRALPLRRNHSLRVAYEGKKQWECAQMNILQHTRKERLLAAYQHELDR